MQILKIKPLGINAALKERNPRLEWRTQSNQTNQIESNSMLNKLNKSRGGFTLVEIMIVVAIIALLAAIAVPGFLRARKRAQASRILNDLRLIDAAVDQYAIENNKTTGSSVNTADWVVYLKKGSTLYNTGKDLFGDDYGQQKVDTLPSVPTTAWNTLSDVAPDAFWSPYPHP
jgi:prepilin-type N-terminal cleavage/methylation domain-containing protein